MFSLPDWPWYSWFGTFLVVWLFQAVRIVVNCIVSYFYNEPVQPPEKPSYTSEDVTVIIPTILDDEDQLRETVQSALDQEPKEIILVTVEACWSRVCSLADKISSKRVRVMTVRQANKRRQMVRAFPEVTTRITLLCDDDVLLPPMFMTWALAPFEDSQVGGVGTSQRLKRVQNPNVWHFLNALYLERRNFDCGSCNWIDGGLPCLSGRAVAYRSGILQDEDFMYEFQHETWRHYQLNADDDNFITRWLMEHDWRIQYQWHNECEVLTTLESNPKYLKQCLRWVRSNWRSNLTSMFVSRNVWTRYPWSSYAVFQTTLTQWVIVLDPLRFFLLYKATSGEEWAAHPGAWYLVWTFFALFWLLSKFIKNMGHYRRYPVDLRLLPVSILFGYFHNGIKFWGLCTLHNTSWGSREGADTDDAARMIRMPRRIRRVLSNEKPLLPA